MNYDNCTVLNYITMNVQLPAISINQEVGRDDSLYTSISRTR